MKGKTMHTNTSTNSSGTPFKHGVSGPEDHDPAEANDFDDIEAQRRHVLPVGKAVIFGDFYRSRVMYIGDVDIPDEGKSVYHLFADPETLRGNGVADYFLDAALSMTTDIYRAPPEEQVYGFYVAPAHLDKPEDKARSDFRLVESIYNRYELKHAERAQREAVYKCHRCKRQKHMRHPEDGEVLFYCGVPDHLEVHAENPEECVYFWFDRWYGSPPDVK
jgi:hypothetical protein